MEQGLVTKEEEASGGPKGSATDLRTRGLEQGS